MLAVATAVAGLAVPPAPAGAAHVVARWTTDDPLVAGQRFAAASSAVAPDRFAAQLYSEALGRAPTQVEWRAYRDGLRGRRCDRALLAGLAPSVLLGGELGALGYTAAERALVTHRALLARDPTPSELTGAVARSSRRGTPGGWRAVVETITGGDEFGAVAGRMCDPAVRDVGWGTTAPPQLPSRPGFSGTQRTVQAALDRLGARGGGVLELAPGTVVSITDPPLLVPAGVTLRTAGEPGPRQYARMARLARDQHLGDDFADLLPRPLVTMSGGAALTNVWLDGQRGRSGRRFGSFTVMVLPGSGTALASNRLDNAAGATNVQSNGGGPGEECLGNRLVGNLVQGYASNHTPVRSAVSAPWSGWTDGISLHCEDALVAGNTVIDASDVGIIAFADRAVREGAPPQRSVVRDNVVVNVGHGAYAALAVDALLPRTETASRREAPDPPDVPSRSFDGSQVVGNLVWTGTRAHFNFVLAVGTGAWFGAGGFVGRGASFTANTTGTGTARAAVGIVVANMRGARVVQNRLTVEPVAVAGCAPARTAITPDAVSEVDGEVEIRANEQLRACLAHP